MLNPVPYFSQCWKQNVEPSAISFQAFSSVIRSFTGSSSQCFETPTASSLSLMLSFYRTNVEPRDVGREKITDWEKTLNETQNWQKCTGIEVSLIIMDARMQVGEWRESVYACELCRERATTWQARSRWSHSAMQKINKGLRIAYSSKETCHTCVIQE